MTNSDGYFEPSGPFRDIAVLSLTNAELAALQAVGLGELPVHGADAYLSEPDFASLVLRQIVDEHGAITDWFAGLWTPIALPLMSAIVIRELPEQRAVMWNYSIRPECFVEQTTSTIGVTLLLAAPADLLQRVLLNMGLMRSSTSPDAARLDPCAGERDWTITLRAKTLTAERQLEAEFESGRLLGNPADLVNEVAALLTGTLAP